MSVDILKGGLVLCWYEWVDLKPGIMRWVMAGFFFVQLPKCGAISSSEGSGCVGTVL